MQGSGTHLHKAIYTLSALFSPQVWDAKELFYHRRDTNRLLTKESVAFTTYDE